jgi:hypothetical protein
MYDIIMLIRRKLDDHSPYANKYHIRVCFYNGNKFNVVHGPIHKLMWSDTKRMDDAIIRAGDSFESATACSIELNGRTGSTAGDNANIVKKFKQLKELGTLNLETLLHNVYPNTVR